MSARTIRLHHLNKNGKPVGYFGFFNNIKHLKDIFQRHEIDEHTLIEPVLVSDKELTKSQINEMFNQLNKIVLPNREAVDDNMKNGKKPTKKQKEAMQRAGLDPNNWLVTKNLNSRGELHLVHRQTPNKKRVVPA
jgi:hypothetical protein